ncbi:MAG: hypothetical protein FWE87_00190 [Coriobacteriia bacterium]|nr:hypothetical protein [Coriobacteriia bacterium]
MTDPGFEDEEVVSVLPSFAGDITFVTNGESHVEARFVPDSWATWSQGYTGLVFYVRDDTVTLELPEGITAFLIYVEPNEIDLYNFYVQANDGTVYSEGVEGDYGAAGFGFYTTGDLTIESVTITTTDEDFAFGQIYLGIEEAPPVTADVVINGEKVVLGTPGSMPDFNFLLIGIDDAGDLIDGSEKYSTVTGEGVFSFNVGELGVGEHAFLLGELEDEDLTDWIFDDEVWLVLVEVFSDGTYDVGYISLTDLDGLETLNEDEIVLDDLTNRVGAFFVNSYVGLPPTGDIAPVALVLSLLGVSGVALGFSRRLYKKD